MKTILLLGLFAAGFSLRLDAAPTSVLFRTEFADDAGTVADVTVTLCSRDADGFPVSRDLKASALPKEQRAQFAAIQAALTSAANTGGWRLVAGELSQTGTTSDFKSVPNPKAGQEGEPLTLSVPVAETSRPILALAQTQARNGAPRYRTLTSEELPPALRSALLALWAWLQSQP